LAPRATAPADSDLRPLLALGLASRVLIDTTTQIFPAYLSFFAEGLGIDLVAMGRIASLRSFSSLLAPVLCGLAVVLGQRRLLRTSLLIGAVATLGVGLSPGPLSAAFAMLTLGASIATFVATLQGYLSDRLPYQRRARGLATIELSWALAGLLGVSLVGLVMEHASWRLPFLGLGLGLLLPWLGLGRLPRDPPAEVAAGSRAARTVQALADSVRALGALLAHPRRSHAPIAVTGLVFFAVLNVLMIYGAWLHDAHGLSPSALGLAALALALADLAGSLGVRWLADRVGKRRVVLAGSLGVLGVSLALPLGAHGLVPALLIIAALRLCFEISVVANLALVSEALPQQRPQALSLSLAAGLLGAGLAGLSGPWCYARWGVVSLAPISSVTALAAVLVVWRFVVEPPAASPAAADQTSR